MIGLGGRVGDDVIERLEQLLGDLPAEATGTPEAVVLPEDGGPVRIHTKQSDQAHLVIGAPSYPHGHPDRYALQLLATVLGGGMSSRLFTEVRERRGLAYYVYCGNNSYADAGTLAAQAGVDLNRIDEAVETIVAELRRVVTESVPADELEKARSFAKGRFVLGLESPHATIMFGLRREVLEGRADRAGRGARGPRRGHRRGPGARRRGDPRREPSPRGDRAVRRSRALRAAARRVARPVAPFPPAGATGTSARYRLRQSIVRLRPPACADLTGHPMRSETNSRIVELP